jgi:hypothetical protein
MHSAPIDTPNGVEIVAAENRVIWHIWAVPMHVEVSLRGCLVRLQALADDGGGIRVVVDAEAPFALEMEAGHAVFYESAPAGRTAYLLTYLDRTDVRQV